MTPAGKRIVVLGMMAKMPVPGVLWQTVHYLQGLQRLGFEPFYVEANGRTPSMLMERNTDDGSGRAAALISRVMETYGMAGQWAYQALHDDGRCYGLSEGELRRLYRDAAVIINLHGGTEPREEFGERLVYLETDPVQLQIELHDGVASTYEFLSAHSAFFTFAENLGRPGCELPVCDSFEFLPTRQPVVLDHWAGAHHANESVFTTVGNWHQGWRTVRYRGESFGWSKDQEWSKFLNLPARTGQEFELALSGFRRQHREQLEAKGWRVRPALDFGNETVPYRDYVAGSRGEFTVAKDQNVRLRTGWFSDRSATYLAAGRPVVTQDTGFGCALPTGEGLFGVSSLDEAAAAIEEVNGDYARHRRAAREIATEHFEAGRVLGSLLAELGIHTGKESQMTERTDTQEETTHTATDAAGREARARPSRPARRRLSKDSSVLALIPHFKCEEWLDDALESLAQQTRPLDGIVVIDDASDDPPSRLVQRHPGVTLMHADRNVGPYRLVQQIIEDTDYDAYLFQDADDWSSPDRLEKLLAAAERTGAELIGTQEMRVFCDEPEVAPISWPLDVKAKFAERPTAFPLLHPTSIVSRDLVMELGGFASGLRFSGDAEFLRRAQHVAKVVNIPDYCYFRRIRQNSLTTARATGLKSPERERVMQMLWDRARRNAELVERGEQPDLSPCSDAPPVGLRRLAGPPLRRTGETATPPARAAHDAHDASSHSGKRGAPRPIFVIGADRSGASALAWALGQHPSLPAVMDTEWISELACELPEVHSRTVAGRHRAKPLSPERFSRTFGRAAAALVGEGLERWVDCAPGHVANAAALAKLFPEALFIHVVRDAEATVRSLVDPPLGSAAATGGTQIPEHLRSRLTERQAVDRWMNAVIAGVEAEKELGERRVLRASYDDLLERPELLVRSCLEFVGEPYDPSCLRPLRGIREGIHADGPAHAKPQAAGKAAHSAAWAAARALSDELLGRRGEAHAAATGRDGEDSAATPRAESRTRLSPVDVERLSAKSRSAAHEIVAREVPEGATVLVASRGDEGIVQIEGRVGIHFPDGESGTEAGGRPASSQDAIAELEKLRARGAGFLLFPVTTLWWLEYFTGLREHLEREHTARVHDPAAGALFELSPVPAGKDGGAPAAAAVNGSRPEVPAPPAEQTPARAAAKAPAKAAPAVGTGPRVVMVTDHFPKFSETFFVSKFLGLRRRGWDVHVVCNRSNDDQWQYFPGLRDDPDLASRLHPTKDFEATVSELRPSLMHFGYGTLALGRMHVAKMLGASTVVSFRGYDVNYFGLEDEHTYEEVWRDADMLHFVGKDTWARAKRRGCPPDKPHAVITDAVDVSRFDPPRRRADVAGTAERPLRIVSVGRLHWKKGHEFGLRAIHELVRDGIDVRYRVIGEGPHREATLFAIHDLGLQDHVELLGALPAEKVREQLGWADVFLHPAVSEGFCVSAIEAQAMSLPVVCSDADGLSENVIDGGTGFVVARRDATLLAKRLASLAKDGALRRQLGRAARRRAMVSFDAEVQTDRFESLYRQLLEDARQAEPPAASPEPEVRHAGLDSLSRELGEAEARSARLKREVFRREVVERVQALAETDLPPGSKVLVVSRGDEAVVELPGCSGWHFPQAEDGEYAGYHPADSLEAVEHLEDLRARGAEFLVIPATSAWWLDYYGGFAEHLDSRYTRLADRSGGYVLFSLSPKGQPRANGAGAAKLNGSRS